MSDSDMMSEPPCKEAEILEGNEVRDEALKEKEKEEADKKVEEEDKKADVKKEEKKEETLPKLSAADFRAYNSMSEHMDYFHNHFRQTHNLLLSSCHANRRPASHSLKSFLSTASSFISHLETHHSIEEAHVFPILARKMPEFRNTAELLRQHREIHKGMEALETYIAEVRSGERELVLREMGEVMEKDGWGDVLWKHLEQEVRTLGAENMRKYWTLEEMKRMPL